MKLRGFFVFCNIVGSACCCGEIQKVFCEWRKGGGYRRVRDIDGFDA